MKSKILTVLQFSFAVQENKIFKNNDKIILAFHVNIITVSKVYSLLSFINR